jgi:hypothetical protein
MPAIISKLDGSIIEFQSGKGDDVLAALVINARSAGFRDGEFEISADTDDAVLAKLKQETENRAKTLPKPITLQSLADALIAKGLVTREEIEKKG